MIAILLFLLLLTSTEQVYQKMGYTTTYSKVYSQSIDDSEIQFEHPAYTEQNAQYDSYGLTHDVHEYGSETVTVDGETVTISWHAQTEGHGISHWYIIYSDGSSESFLGSLGRVKKHASGQAKEKARKQAEEKIHSVPIGDPPLYFILSMLFLWMMFDILDRITNNDDQ